MKEHSIYNCPITFKKILLFTHTDLDGYSCYIVAKYHVNNVDVHMCEPSKVEEKMKENMNANIITKYDMVILSDLSVSVEFAKEYAMFCEKCGVDFYIVDHHKKANDSRIR